MLKVIRLKENQGHGNARRCGLAHCSNELVALMDSDDICVSDRFEQQLCFLLENDVCIVGGNIAEFVQNIDNTVAYRNVPTEDSQIKSYMKRRCPFNQMTVMFRKSDVEKAGGYLDWYCNEDYYLWLRMFLMGSRMANTGTVLVHVRVGYEMYQRRGGLNYFKSELNLQGFMLKKGVIVWHTYLENVAKRFVIQVLLPNGARGWAFRKFARSRG